MTLNEYLIYSHGYFLRHHRQMIGLRRIYVLIYNALVKPGSRLLSSEAISNQWPLLTDVHTVDLLTKEEKMARLEKAKALTASQRKR